MEEKFYFSVHGQVTEELLSLLEERVGYSLREQLEEFVDHNHPEGKALYLSAEKEK